MNNFKPLKILIDYCAKGHSNPSAEEIRQIRSFLLVWLSTTLIMWFYVVFSYWVFDFPIVGSLGIIYSFIHTLAPVIYRYTISLTMAGVTISLTAIFFQVTFCIYNGGIHSPSAIWFTAHPVIISFFASKRLILFSVCLNMVLVIGLTLIGNYGILPVDSLPASFTQYMMISSLIFLDVIIATYTIVFIMTTEEHSKELEERNNLIENLMKIIGHDISNALNISSMSSKALGKMIDPCDAKMARKLELINKSNKQITEISQSVLQWMKSQENSFKLDLQPLEVDELCDFIHESIATTTCSKDIKFELDCTLVKGSKITVDTSAFKYQVITNILTNAVKFTPQGGTITVKIKELGDEVLFTFIDTGIGMPKKMLKEIFDPSKGTSRKGTDGESGTGFGLPIVKTLIEGMNGRINISSIETSEDEKKQGTTINIAVPVYKEN